MAPKRKRRRGPHLTLAEKQTIAREYQHERLSLKVIAGRHNRALSTIDAVIKEMGIPRRYYSYREEYPEGQSPEELLRKLFIREPD